MYVTCKIKAFQIDVRLYPITHSQAKGREEGKKPQNVNMDKNLSK